MSWSVFALFVILSGCAGPPRSAVDGLPWATRKHKVTDAKLQRVAHWPALRVDAASLAELEAAMNEPDLQQARAGALRFVEHAHADALSSARDEWDRLSPGQQRALSAHYLSTDAEPDALWAAFQTGAAAQADELRHRIASAESLAGVRRELRSIHRSVEPSPKTSGRVARAAPWVMFAPFSAWTVKRITDHEYRGSHDEPFERAVRYELADAASTVEQPDHWDLLQTFAPTIVQEAPAAPAYGAEVDRFGRIEAASPESFVVRTEDPTVYAYARDVLIGGAPHVQLTYTYWFPEQPPLKKNDPEAGPFDGATLRITLDHQGRPEVFETVDNCGCFHRLFPSTQLEEQAAAEHGAPEPSKHLSIEHRVPWKIDLMLPRTVEVQRGDTSPVIRGRAGWHGIVDVAMSEGDHAGEVTETRRYALRPYHDLEHLPLPDGGFTSLFYDNGLVKHAQRPEGVFFTPLGMLSAGQPRQRGTQLIHWDQYDFDDPHLFETALRLPSGF